MAFASVHLRPVAPRNRPPSQWLRLALPLLLISLLIGALSAAAYRYLGGEIRHETHRTLAVIAEQKRQSIEASLAEIRLDAQLYFSGHSRIEQDFAQWLRTGRRDDAALERMQGFMNAVAQARAWAGIAVLDGSGERVAMAGDAELSGHDAVIADIMRRPRLEFVDLHRNAHGLVQYGVLVPIRASVGGAPQGVAYVALRADSLLYPMVGSWPVPTRTAETYLVRRDGDAVRFLTPLRHRQDAALALVKPLGTPALPAARAVKGERGIIEGGRDYRGVAVLAYASAVAGTPWIMLAEIDELEAYSGIRTLTWGMGVLLGTVLLMIYSSGYLLWRRDRQRRELAALQARQTAEARFRVIFEQAPLGVVLLDPRSGCITEANQRFADIVGRSPAELVGVEPAGFTHPDDVDESRDKVRRLGAGEIGGYRINKRYLRPDGSVVWVSLTFAPVRVETEEAPRYLGIVEDITARKQMEERLRISEERHRLLADNAIDVIVTLDLDGRFSYVSPSVERLRGYTADEALRQTLDEVLTPDSLNKARAYLASLRASLANGGALETFRGELEHCCKDGSTVWADVTASPILSADGSFVEILGVTRDISERMRHERELQQAYETAEAANAAKSEFLAHMSHEIRTPMNAVLGLAQVLEREPLADNQREMVERIRSAGQSLLAILNDVLDLSKIEAGQLRIEPRPFELGALLANLDSLMGQTARAKGLVLRTYAPATPLGPLVGDGLRLEQVLFNLTGNAIKFTEQGEVALLVQVRDSSASAVRLRFEVRDSGIGIAPEALQRLFAPFTQADAGIGRRYGGTGLGLSICKRLVELMGGEIGAESQLGHGSVFWFELPFARAAEADAPPAPVRSAAQSAGPRLAGAHVLVVDDSAMNRDLVERALRLEGATATLAADGQQAVQLLKTRSQGFDAVLMDVQMPVMDGLSAMRFIRAELGLRELPIIAFTAGVREDQQAAARDAGANDVLPKPMDLEQMAQVLARWLDAGPRAAGTASAGPMPAAAESAGAPLPAAAATTAALTDGFPAIPGIDRARVVQRLGKDPAMFLGLLELFFEDNAEAVPKTREDLARGDREAAARRMHTLRSNAGFICALDLMESAGALEQAIEQGANDIDARLDTLGRQIDALQEASGPWR
ncbi:PAS domain S-box protein [Thauera sp. 2A1]|uniref:PAS domain S-box protein n=1 Tax=Thauera sp. 2A1 TaxID=2570191 RepID=UPI001291F3F2|nr:PAS domain S-box protein [Thauera sp. 2A1]KAI5913697.1 PAS domain S-box protein [Thauera sp. 2A1]